MRAEELLDISFAMLASSQKEIDQLAGRTRTKALEYWLQCELTTTLLNYCGPQYREVVTEWYIPKVVAESPIADGECDILLIHQAPTNSLRELYDSRQLIDGVYIELKTSVHNDFSPTPQRADILKKLLRDYRRINNIKAHSHKVGLRTEAFLLALIVDASPLEFNNRKPCLAQIAEWLNENESLHGVQFRELSFGNGRGLTLWVWQ